MLTFFLGALYVLILQNVEDLLGMMIVTWLFIVIVFAVDDKYKKLVLKSKKSKIKKVRGQV